MSLMMQFVADKLLPQMPLSAERTVVDVSGDGHDNCNPSVSVDSQRDALVDSGVTVNGLPIREGNEAATIEGWYQAHVIGGAGSFLLPADGYADFARADLSRADLSGANLAGADLGGSDLDGTILRGVAGFPSVRGLDTAHNRDKAIE